MKGQIISQSVQLNNGLVFDDDRINELTKYIINKFADEGLSLEEAVIVLSRVKEVMGEFALIQHLN